MVDPSSSSVLGLAPTGEDATRMGEDAKLVAQLYPVRGEPDPGPWHVGSLKIPDSLRKLTNGLSGYGN